MRNPRYRQTFLHRNKKIFQKNLKKSVEKKLTENNEFLDLSAQVTAGRTAELGFNKLSMIN